MDTSSFSKKYPLFFLYSDITNLHRLDVRGNTINDLYLLDDTPVLVWFDEDND